MKISILFVGLAFSVFTLADTSKTPLLPEVKRIIDAKAANEDEMINNSYVYLMAINAKDDDYFAVGKRIVLETNKIVRQAIHENSLAPINSEHSRKIFNYEKIPLDLEIDHKTYKYPCYDLTNTQCLDEVIARPEVAAELFKKNHLLLTRYRQLIQQSNHYTMIPPVTLTSPIAAFTVLLRLSELNQLEAVELIKQGQTQQGLKILEQELDFAKQMLVGNGQLIDKAIALKMLLTLYHTIEALLDQSSMQASLNSTQLIRLLKPFTAEEQQAIANGMENDNATNIVHFITMGEHIVANPYAVPDINYLSYNRNQLLNEIIVKYKPVINFAKMDLPDAQKNYQALLAYELKPICDQNDSKTICIDKVTQQYPKNILGGMFLDLSFKDDREYLYRLYDVSSYLALIHVKLTIKQQGITNKQIPAFLDTLGDRAKNPYTQESFIWHENLSILSTKAMSKQWKYDLTNNTFRVKLFFDTPSSLQ